MVSKFGYSLGVSTDVENKVVRSFGVFPANVHDSRILKDIVHFDNEDPHVLGDKAFPSQENKEFLGETISRVNLLRRNPRGKKCPKRLHVRMQR